MTTPPPHLPDSAEALIQRAQEIYHQVQVFWAQPLVAFLDRKQHGLGGRWARACVRRLLPPDSAWHASLDELDQSSEGPIDPEALQATARAIWYRPGDQTAEQSAVARLYWAAAYELQAREAARSQYSTALEVLVGREPEQADRFVLCAGELRRLLAELEGAPATAP